MSNIYDLVFEGGGAKGAVFVGAMEAFYARGCKHRRLIGTSAGAITATLLAAGFNPADLRSFAQEKKDDKPVFASFMDSPEREFCEQFIDSSDVLKELDKAEEKLNKEGDWFHNTLSVLTSSAQKEIIKKLLHIEPYRQLFSFIECGGMYAGEIFVRWLQDKLDKKGIAADITLADFCKSKEIDLSLVASNTSKCRMLVLNHRTAPGCPLVWAVRMSMSIPFVWSEVVWRKEWGKYLDEDMTGDRIVDGGMLSNFPLFLVEKDAEGHHDKKRIMGSDLNDEDAGTIGLLIDENLPVPGQREEVQCSFSSRLKTMNRVNNLINTMRRSHDNEMITKKPQLVCRLPAKGYGTTEFDMADHRLAALINAGRDAMNNYLNGKARP